jgi:hypothetical protein
VEKYEPGILDAPSARIPFVNGIYQACRAEGLHYVVTIIPRRCRFCLAYIEKHIFYLPIFSDANKNAFHVVTTEICTSITRKTYKV